MGKQVYNIGLNASMLDDHPTGVGVYTANLSNSLSGLYSTISNRNLLVFSPTNNRLHRDVSIVRIPRILKSSRYGKLASASRFLWNLFGLPVQSRKCDVLLSTTTHANIWLKNQIVTIHDLISLRYRNISSHQRFYFTHYLPRLVKNARKIIAVSEATKADIVSFLGCAEDRIEVVYNGYDKNVFCDKSGAGDRVGMKYGFKDYFFAIGPTYPHKNFDRLIEAYFLMGPEIRDKHPLVIAGGLKPYLDEVISMVAQKGLSGKVHFLGYVPENDLPDLYRAAVCLVFPSLHEGFGFPLVEAMACACPVLASSVSSMPEVCGDAAVYFDPLSAEDISNKMNLVSRDPDKREQLKSKGLQRCKLFSWELTAQRVKDIIETNLI